MKIAIIGAGLAGSNLLKSILEHKNYDNEQIYIFEKNERFGPGEPYKCDTKYRLLNTSNYSMSIEKGNPFDFNNWLNENEKKISNFEKMTPREYYGEYLEDRFSKYLNHKNVIRVNEEVIDIEVSNENTFSIKTDKQTIENFDNVFLTIGHPKYNDFYNLEGKDKYQNNPYPLSEKLDSITSKDRVGIIGAGASSIDIFRYLMQEKKMETPIYFFVRESIFHQPSIPNEIDNNFTFSFSDEWISKNSDKNGFIKLDTIINQVKEDLLNENIDFMKYYNQVKEKTVENYKKLLKEKSVEITLISKYFIRIATFFSTLYASLTINDQKRYMKKYDKMLEPFYNVTPYETSKWIIECVEKGKVIFEKNLDEIEIKNGKFIAKGDNDIEVDYLLNATGFNFNLEENTEENTLLKNLYNKKMIQPDDEGKFINVTAPNLNILSKKYGELKNFYVIGMWAYGVLIRANSADIIIRSTRAVADRFMGEK
ncbi:FAD/NAD(P)-binding protein [Helcococcus kunzii]